MRIGENPQPFHNIQYSHHNSPVRNTNLYDTPQPSAAGMAVPDPERTNYLSRPGVMVDLSPEAKTFMASAAYTGNEEKGEGGESGPRGFISLKPVGSSDKTAPTTPVECQTCKNRRYVDGSDDPSVSFQTPTHIGPAESASAVSAHENEHVTHEQARADRDGRRIISQTVTIQTAICPECGRVYVSGGVTRTISADDNKAEGNEEPPSA